MNMDELSEKLLDVSQKIRLHRHHLTDKRCIDEAGRLLNALLRFERLVDSVSQGSKPVNHEFKQVIQNVFNEGISDINELGEFSKKVLGKKVSGIKKATFTEYRDKVVSEIINKDKAEFALLLLRRMSAEPLIQIVENTPESILLQVRRLGALSDEQIETEKRHLLKDKDTLTLLARTAGVNLKPSYKPETIFRRLLEIAKRYYENTL
ncbi:MAG: hypothetical protein SNJ53_01600 [Thermodesulfovibrionales bacterium]